MRLLKLLILIVFAAALPAVAGPLEDGQAALAKKDYATALRLLRPLAEQGVAAAQFSLGGMYYSGQGVSWNQAKAMSWYLKAADQGNSKAQIRLSMFYEHGLGGQKDVAQAVYWIRRAVDQGDAEAQNILGGMYLVGVGVLEDHVQAVSWFRRAAERRDAAAQNNLGNMYRFGMGGLPMDDVQTYKWYNLAATLGEEYTQADARKNRAEIAARLTPAQISEAQKLSREWKPKQ